MANFVTIQHAINILTAKVDELLTLTKPKEKETKKGNKQ